MKKILILIFSIVLIFSLVATTYAAEAAGDEQTVEKSYVDSLIDKLSTSSFWVTVASFLTAIVSILAVVKKNFGKVSVLIRNKATTEELKAALTEAKSDISSAYSESIASIEAKIKDEQDNLKKLSIILSIFISNAKINPNARAEILKYITEIKEVSGTVAEVVERANEAIESANSVENKEPTPILDEVVKEAKTGLALD